MLHPRYHVRKIVIGVGVLAVGIDANKAHAFDGERVGGFARRFIAADDVGTVVAGKKDYQNFGVGEIIQGITFSVSGRKTGLPC